MCLPQLLPKVLSSCVDGTPVPADKREEVARCLPFVTVGLTGFMQQSRLKKIAGHVIGINPCTFHTSGSVVNPCHNKFASPGHIFKELLSWAQKNEYTSMARDCGRQKIILLLIFSCRNGQCLVPFIIGKPTVFNFSQVICSQTNKAVQECSLEACLCEMWLLCGACKK